MHSNLSKNRSRYSQDSQPLVLIVDNDKDNLLLASCVIESMGMNYVVIDNSERCLNLVRELLPDIILLNIVMPKISGLEIARILKQERNFSAIPIIAVTGLTRDEDKKQLIKAGFDDYLCKPYLIADLETKLKHFLKDFLV